MTVPQIAPGATIPIAQASQAGSCYKAALAYHSMGLSMLPLKGKRPSLNEWKQHQKRRPTTRQINSWQGQGLLENVGIICGEVSGNLVVLDFDGPGAYGAFAALFPILVETYTIATGSGDGKHVYLYVDRLPPTILSTVINFHFERWLNCRVRFVTLQGNNP
ncbi:MAG: bifunctional DNA primase/polymerase, partial [Anaerolineae bacterium]|nr:bifunctional DNA primase/polymerase [Anaerolineae bacterium]